MPLKNKRLRIMAGPNGSGKSTVLQEVRKKFYTPLYSFKNTIETTCDLSLQLPATPHPWMILLKACCQELNRPSRHYEDFGMKVIMVGGG